MQLVEVSPGDSLADLFDAGIPNIGYEISRLDFVFHRRSKAPLALGVGTTQE